MQAGFPKPLEKCLKIVIFAGGLGKQTRFWVGFPAGTGQEPAMSGMIERMLDGVDLLEPAR